MAETTDAPDALTRYTAAVDAEMRATLAGRAVQDGQQDIYDMARYALGWQDAAGHPTDAAGKGARAALCMLGAEAIDGGPDHLRRAACGAAAVEFVHNFSLVHDDIQDGDAQRRGRDTVWKIWGQAQGINAGDALRELADAALYRAADAGADAATIMDAARRLNRATLRMIEGQYLDLTFEQRLDVEVDEYLAMVERKTGAMMGVSLALGAVFAGAEAERADALDRAGQALGRCFQMRDDWLGIWGDSDTLGKPTNADIRRRKKSYPVLFALREASSEVRRRLLEIYSDPRYDHEDLSDDVVDRVHTDLSEVGADRATDRAANDELHAFRRELASCDPQSDAADRLKALAAFVLQRDF